MDLIVLVDFQITVNLIILKTFLRCLKKKISKKHYQDILNFKKIKNFLNKSNNSNQKLLPKNISSSNNFSDTSIKYLKKKINF